MDKENAIAKLSCILAAYQYRSYLIENYDIDCCDSKELIESIIEKTVNYTYVLMYGCDYNYDDIICFIEKYDEDCNNVTMRVCDVDITLLSDDLVCEEAPFELTIL